MNKFFMRKEAGLKQLSKLIGGGRKADELYASILRKLKDTRRAGTHRMLAAPLFDEADSHNFLSASFGKPGYLTRKQVASKLFNRTDLPVDAMADEYIGKLLHKPGYWSLD